MCKVEISSTAYAKIILHAAKYPHCAVNGVILAKSHMKNDNLIEISDAIPFFHLCPYLAPMSEIALIETEAIAKVYDSEIIGYYAAAENFYDCSINKVPGAKIADKIAENSDNAFFIVVDNKQITMTNKPAIKMWKNVDSQWQEIEFSLKNCKITLEAVLVLLQRGAMKDIFDFDNHLDNPENGWMNISLNKDLESIGKMY